MANTFVVEVTIPALPEGKKKWEAGDTFSVEVEAPAVVKKPRGQLAGLTLEEMTDEQLKREIINANSVLYKAKQRGAAEETIAANQARVDAAIAERTKRQGIKTPANVEAENVEAALADAPAETANPDINEETAAEM